jgi:hypothetical protein
LPNTMAGRLVLTTHTFPLGRRITVTLPQQ